MGNSASPQQKQTGRPADEARASESETTAFDDPALWETNALISRLSINESPKQIFETIYSVLINTLGSRADFATNREKVISAMDFDGAFKLVERLQSLAGL